MYLYIQKYEAVFNNHYIFELTFDLSSKPVRRHVVGYGVAPSQKASWIFQITFHAENITHRLILMMFYIIINMIGQFNCIGDDK